MSAITVAGNLVSTPETRVTPSGNHMTTGTVVENHGYTDKNTGAWVETPPTFWAFVIWGLLGINAAACLVKGDRVIVSGDTRTNTWEDKDTGAPRSRVELTVREIGPSLKFAEARPVRRTKTEKPGEGAPPAEDPWATSPI